MQLRPALLRLRAISKPVGVALLRDGPGVAGVVLVSAGVGEIYRPAGLIVLGTFLLVGSILAARARFALALRAAAAAEPQT